MPDPGLERGPGIRQRKQRQMKCTGRSFAFSGIRRPHSPDRKPAGSGRAPIILYQGGNHYAAERTQQQFTQLRFPFFRVPQQLFLVPELLVPELLLQQTRRPAVIPALRPQLLFPQQRLFQTRVSRPALRCPAIRRHAARDLPQTPGLPAAFLPEDVGAGDLLRAHPRLSLLR